MLKNIYLCGINNNLSSFSYLAFSLWFAWKYLPLWYQQQHSTSISIIRFRCDLLENIYLCGINNNYSGIYLWDWWVVICLKISTFVVSTTTGDRRLLPMPLLWFAWKYLPLWYQQQLHGATIAKYCVVICLKISTFVVSTTTNIKKPCYELCCDLLENIYLCGINNN